MLAWEKLQTTEEKAPNVFNIGSQELLIILLLVFLFFGPRHLPEVARTLGKGLGDFQRTLRGVEDNVRRASEETIGRASAVPSIFDKNLLDAGPADPAGGLENARTVAALAGPAPDASEPKDDEGTDPTVNPS